MDDHEQVHQLLARYAHALDDEDAVGVAEVFAEDGVFEVMGHSFEGRIAIADMVRQYSEAGALAGGKHLTVNSVISLDGAAGVAVSDWVAIRAGEGGWSVLAAGRYHDDLVKSGGWLIKVRRDRIDGPVPEDADAASGTQKA